MKRVPFGDLGLKKYASFHMSIIIRYAFPFNLQENYFVLLLNAGRSTPPQYTFVVSLIQKMSDMRISF